MMRVTDMDDDWLIDGMEEDLDEIEVSFNPLIHTTKEGKEILIYKMDDNHLINTIGFIAKRVTTIIENSLTIGRSSIMDQVMSNKVSTPEKRRDAVKDNVIRIYTFLSKYIVEALRRGMDKDVAFAMADVYRLLSFMQDNPAKKELDVKEF